jgi:hypothetical protein
VCVCERERPFTFIFPSTPLPSLKFNILPSITIFHFYSKLFLHFSLNPPNSHPSKVANHLCEVIVLAVVLWKCRIFREDMLCCWVNTCSSHVSKAQGYMETWGTIFSVARRNIPEGIYIFNIFVFLSKPLPNYLKIPFLSCTPVNWERYVFSPAQYCRPCTIIFTPFPL